MAGLQNLKKKLRSIRATGQLAGAMKTVSAAKYSKIGALNEAYAGYAQAARALRERFSRDLASAMPCGNPDAPDGYLVLSSNRGLCGGYNNELLAEAMRRLRESPRPWLLMTGGKVAETFFQSKGLPIHRAFRVPDVPGYADVQALCTELLEAYRSGEISSVRLVYQHFQNVLTQLPRVETLLPFAAGEDVGKESAEASHHGAAEGSPAADTVLCLPDRRTVVRAAGLTCFQSGVYAAVLEAAAGAQAATMMAMRSAYDNAEETSARLELELNRRRQSEVTAGVIETSSDFEQ